MLEENIKNAKMVARVFLRGSFYYSRYDSLSVLELRNFINLIKSCNVEKFNVIMMNIHNRLDSIQRYSEDIPF
jgi:serine/threonine-protein kinase